MTSVIKKYLDGILTLQKSAQDIYGAYSESTKKTAKISMGLLTGCLVLILNPYSTKLRRIGIVILLAAGVPIGASCAVTGFALFIMWYIKKSQEVHQKHEQEWERRNPRKPPPPHLRGRYGY